MLIENENVIGLYDPGANISMIHKRLLKKLKSGNVIKNMNTFRTLSGEDVTEGIVWLKIKIFEIEKDARFFVTKSNEFSYDLLLGLDNIAKFRLCQDENLKISQKPENENKNVELPHENSQKSKNENRKSELVHENEDITWNDAQINWSEYIPVNDFDMRTGHLDREQKKQIYDIVDQYGSLFAKDKYDIGNVRGHEAQIKLIEHTFVSRKPYRCSFEDQKEIESQVTQLLQHGIIEESCSPFAAPVTLAYKKDGDTRKKNRLCVDFRELNKLVVPETQPFPIIDDLIVRTQGCQWFSCFDINSAFWTIPIRMKDRYKTGFVTQQAHYQWRSLPFGYRNASAIFQRILSGVIRRNNLQGFCTNYIDDILVHSKSFVEHVQHIRALFEAIQKEGFRLKFSKCKFAVKEIEYLGHVIGRNTVRPLTDNLIAMRDFPAPKTKKNVRQFLGKVNFYHKYIKDSAKVLAPFHDLLRKNNEFAWTNECKQTFELLKKYMMSSPVLAVFDQTAPIHIYTDASIEGIGAVLKQPQADGSEKPVAYFSRKLNEAQKKKKAIYIECMAIREAVKYWQYWLLGNKFVVFSDHKPLENLCIKARTDEELGDLVNYLLQFNFEVRYKAGPTNLEADCLSRNPVLESSEGLLDDVVKVVNVITLREITENQKEIKQNKGCIVKNDILYKVLKGRERIFLTESGGMEIIKKLHLKNGHIGMKSLINMIQPYYYFRNMYRKINEYCASCDICLRNKTRKRKEKGSIGHLGPATEPFEIMSIDTIGGFGGRRSTKKYLHLLVDHFTRYAYVTTAKNQSSDDFIRLIDKVHNEHPIGTLLTDQFGGLSSKEFRAKLKERNINHVFTAVDCPSSNGLNERLNQTLVNRIRCRINERKSKVSWATIAHVCVNEYNDTVHSATLFAPSYLMYAKELEIVPPELKLPGDLANDRKTAFLNSLRNHEENRLRINKRKDLEYVFKVGEMVYIDNGNKLNREKLDEIRSGPFPIVRKISSSIFVVDTGSKKNADQNIYHISKMVPYASSSAGLRV